MPGPVSVDEFRDRVRRAFDRDARLWAVADDHDVVIDAPLHPPTERAALEDQAWARSWVDAWRAEEARGDVTLSWATRAWSKLGSQVIPERATVRGADALARVAGTTESWRRLVGRTSAVRRVVGVGVAANAAVRMHARAIAGLDDADAERLVDVLTWLRENPVSGRLVRELPIRGVDTKWVEMHRGLVEALHRAGTGAAGLGLQTPSALVRFRVLDSSLAVGGLRDVSAPADDLAVLPLKPHRVIVVENLATMLAMPDADDTIVIHGGGYRVDLVARLPWAQRVTYWGDLDSHGFAILHRLRSRGVVAQSVLMDSDTLLAHRDLWSTDPEPNLAALSYLSDDERETLQRLSAEGNVRLEQERVPWDFALRRLTL